MERIDDWKQVEEKNYIDGKMEAKLKEFQQYLEESSLEEQLGIAQDWSRRVEGYLNKDPQLKNTITGNTVEQSERSEFVKESSVENLENLEALNKALRDYPDVSEAKKMAIEDVVYGMVNNSEKDMQNTLNKIEDKSDKYIEA